MIQPPKWARDAYPVLNGWMKRGELLLVRKHTQTELDEWYAGKKKKPEPIDEVEKPVVPDYEEEVKSERKSRTSRTKKALKRLFDR